MTALEQQIVTDYEVNGTAIELLAQDYNLEQAIIQATLLKYSSKYQEEHKDGKEEDISQREYEEIKRALKQIALYGESEAIRARVGIFLFNEKKGRNDGKGKNINNTKVNILMLNDHIKQARKALLTNVVKTIEAEVTKEEE